MLAAKPPAPPASRSLPCGGILGRIHSLMTVAPLKQRSRESAFESEIGIHSPMTVALLKQHNHLGLLRPARGIHSLMTVAPLKPVGHELHNAMLLPVSIVL